MSRVVCSWSGGKDAAATLDVLRRDPTTTVAGLFTTVSRPHDRVTIHGVHRDLIAAQADRLGLPVEVVTLPADASNAAYEAAMARAMAALSARGVDAVAFGDLALADVRAYRTEQLAATPVSGRWPIWGWDTAAVAAHVIDRGIRATVVCVDADTLDPSFLGRSFDRSLLADLPDTVDPCGEEGAFHTFVHDGPGFAAPLTVRSGDRVTRAVGDGRFHYLDLAIDGHH